MKFASKPLCLCDFVVISKLHLTTKALRHKERSYLSDRGLHQPVSHKASLQAGQEPSHLGALPVAQECQIDGLEELLGVKALFLGHSIDQFVNLGSRLLL